MQTGKRGDRVKEGIRRMSPVRLPAGAKELYAESGKNYFLPAKHLAFTCLFTIIEMIHKYYYPPNNYTTGRHRMEIRTKHPQAIANVIDDLSHNNQNPGPAGV